jgi:hypothetical protein
LRRTDRKKRPVQQIPFCEDLAKPLYALDVWWLAIRLISI